MESDFSEPPSDALAAVAETRSAAADRLVTPWWYHPALGLWTGSFAVVNSLGDIWIRGAVLLIFLAGCLAMVVFYRRLTGMRVMAATGGAANRWAGLTGGVTVAIAIAAVVVADYTDLVWLVVAIAVVLAVAVTVLGRRTDVALRAQIRGEG